MRHTPADGPPLEAVPWRHSQATASLPADCTLAAAWQAGRPCPRRARPARRADLGRPRRARRRGSGDHEKTPVHTRRRPRQDADTPSHTAPFTTAGAPRRYPPGPAETRQACPRAAQAGCDLGGAVAVAGLGEGEPPRRRLALLHLLPPPPPTAPQAAPPQPPAPTHAAAHAARRGGNAASCKRTHARTHARAHTHT